MAGTYIAAPPDWYVVELSTSTRRFRGPAYRVVWFTVGTDYSDQDYKGAYCVVRGVPEHRTLKHDFDGITYVLAHESELHMQVTNWLKENSLEYLK